MANETVIESESEVRLTPIVHQAVFTRDRSGPVNGYVREAIDSVSTAFPGCRHRIWGLEAAADFVEEHFDPHVVRSFHSLQPLAYKADLFKYCVLYVTGGWYVDAGVRMLRSPLQADFASSKVPPQFVLFRSTGPADTAWNCSLALLYAEPSREVFLTAIAEVVENCRSQNYGYNPLSPTMSPFGRALALHNVCERVFIGKVVDVNEAKFRRAFELGPLGLVAARKPKGKGAGDISHLGMPGVNNYWDMWHENQVFGIPAEAWQEKDLGLRFSKSLGRGRRGGLNTSGHRISTRLTARLKRRWGQRGRIGSDHSD